MHRTLEHTRIRAGRAGIVAALALTAVAVFGLPAGANTGHVVATQTCYAWSASVTLDNNVKTDFFVEVTTSIPGTTGIVDAHYNTTANTGTTQIWEATGPAPASGTVTLTILYPDRTVDSTASASLATPNNCTPSTTAVPAPSTMPPTTTQQTPTSTSTGPTSTTTDTPTPTTLAPNATGQTTTSIVVSPVSVHATTTTTFNGVSTVATQGSPVSTTIAAQPISVTATLPRTGSGTVPPAVFGVCCVATGALLALRRRATSTRT